MANGVTRTETPAGEVRLEVGGCVFAYRRLRPGAMLVTITGHDAGQFGTSTLDEIRLELLRHRPLDLFVDAREALGPAVSVSDDWTHFFSLNRDQLRRVSVLVGSKVVHLTIAIAQHLSRTGNLIQIYSDPEIFGARVDSALP
ncbi:MAG TPA: hypothetical protein VH560_08270 [Polyangia bacterium]|jgi:hypothetical protein|nr:hypothetical protein [Polyangia bacterium]